MGNFWVPYFLILEQPTWQHCFSGSGVRWSSLIGRKKGKCSSLIGRKKKQPSRFYLKPPFEEVSFSPLRKERERERKSLPISVQLSSTELQHYCAAQLSSWAKEAECKETKHFLKNQICSQFWTDFDQYILRRWFYKYRELLHIVRTASFIIRMVNLLHL